MKLVECASVVQAISACTHTSITCTVERRLHLILVLFGVYATFIGALSNEGIHGGVRTVSEFDLNRLTKIEL